MNRHLIIGAFVLLILSGYGCDAVNDAGQAPDGDQDRQTEAARYTPGPNEPALGDSVITLAAVDVWNSLQDGAPIGTQPAGAVGVITNGPKTTAGVVWARVDFSAGVDGLVLYAQLENYSGGGDPPPPPPPPGDLMVGFVGCSMTRDLAQPGLSNYTDIPAWLKFAGNGDKVMANYSGGTIGRWGFPGDNGYNNKWSAFERGVDEWGATVVLWQLCIRSDEVSPGVTDYDGALEHIYGRIAAALPGVTVFVTGLPTYEPGHVCSITGAEGVPYSHELAERAGEITGATFAAGLALELEDAGDLTGDGCHASNDGAAEEGIDFKAWLEAN